MVNVRDIYTRLVPPGHNEDGSSSLCLQEAIVKLRELEQLFARKNCRESKRVCVCVCGTEGAIYGTSLSYT